MMLFSSNVIPKNRTQVDNAVLSISTPTCAHLQIPQDGLVSSFLLEGTGNDSVNNYNLQEHSMEYSYINPLGIVGHFNGVDSYLTTPTINEMSEWSMTFWFKPINTSDNGYIFMASSQTDFSINYFKDNEYLLLMSSGNSSLATSNHSLPIDTLHHVTITSSSTGTNIYIDGALDTSSGTPYNIPHTTFTLGQYSSTFSNMFLSNVHLYSRELTDAERIQIMRMEMNRHRIVIDDGLVQFYPLNGNSLDNAINQMDGVDYNIDYPLDPDMNAKVAYFNGTSSYLTVENPVALTDWSFSVWVKPTQTTDEGFFFISSDTTSLEIRYTYSEKRVYIHDSSNNTLTTPNSSFQYEVFQHVVITSTSNETIIYIDGEQIAESSLNYQLIADTFTIGKGASAYSCMDLLNLRLYNRAITLKEVNTIYATEKPNSEICPLDNVIHDPDPFRDSSGLALWRFDGDLTDDAGRFDLTGTSAFSLDGVFNKALALDGTARNIQGGVIPEFKRQYFNMSCWVKFNSLGTSQIIMDNHFVAHGSGSANAGAFIGIDLNSKFKACYAVKNGEDYTDSNGNSSSSYGIQALSSITAEVDTWYHLSANFNDTSCSLYINNVLDGYVSSTASMIWEGTEGYFSIGSNEINYADFHYNMVDGIIDQARFFNRVLIESEIDHVFNDSLTVSTPPPASEPDLTIWDINNTTFSSLDSQYISDKSDIESTFYYDSTLGLGWGKASSTDHTMVINVPPNVTDLSVTFSGGYTGMGSLSITDQDDNILLLFIDAWSSDASGQRLHINGESIYENDQIVETNRTEVFPIYEASVLNLSVHGDSNYGFNKRYIRELKFS